MNKPTYEAIEAIIRLDQSQPVTTDDWKKRIFHTTIATVEMMNRNGVEKEKVEK